MNQLLRTHADAIVKSAINAVKPDEAVARALEGKEFPGRVLLVAAGKAAWQMAKAASDCLGDRIRDGVVVTKYDHVMGPIANFACYEAGHPVPDENSFKGTQAALDLVSNLTVNDTVLFLLSGGGSALFEKPLVPGEVLQDVTGQLLACGADIVEINTIRKRLSGVKGGRFAQICAPAHVFSIVLSDILGDPLDMIASGPAYPDSSTCVQAIAIAEKYGLSLTAGVRELLLQETPKELDNVTTQITGSVRELCTAAAAACRELGYEPVLLTDQLCCQAKEAGSFLASVLKTHAGAGNGGSCGVGNVICRGVGNGDGNGVGSAIGRSDGTGAGRNLAFLAGGETVVHLTGKGKGGRNQELALAAAAGIAGNDTMAVFSVGSDGTDGPTDAAGGYADGDTAAELLEKGYEVYKVLQDNDAYTALGAVGGLIFTGPTGTNVNDVAVALLRGE